MNTNIAPAIRRGLAENFAVTVDEYPGVACVLPVRPFSLSRDLEPIFCIYRDRGLRLLVKAGDGLSIPADKTAFRLREEQTKILFCIPRGLLKKRIENARDIV